MLDQLVVVEGLSESVAHGWAHGHNPRPRPRPQDQDPLLVAVVEERLLVHPWTS